MVMGETVFGLVKELAAYEVYVVTKDTLVLKSSGFLES